MSFPVPIPALGTPTAMLLALLLAVAIPVLLVHLAFYKEFLFVSFDRETARTLGYNVTFWNLFLYFTLGLVIAFANGYGHEALTFSGEEPTVTPEFTAPSDVLTATAQELFAGENLEYPANPGIPMADLIKGWGEYRADLINVSQAGAMQAEAVKLMDRAGYR